jgi:hypothetical protein
LQVSLNDGSDSLGKSNFRESSPASSNPQEVSTETEAVQYFRNKRIKKGEHWMAIIIYRILYLYFFHVVFMFKNFMTGMFT